MQLSGRPKTSTKKNHVRTLLPGLATLTPFIATDEPLAAAVLVTVTTPVPVTVPERVIVSGFGVIDSAARAATLEPVSDTGVGVTVAPV